MNANIGFLKQYLPKSELASLMHSARGEEGEYFVSLLKSTEQAIRAVPPLYANEHLGTDARVRLHYFGGAHDIWITELDHETGEAFGFTCLGGDWDNAELGYVSIPEIVATDRLELDLYWNDEKTLKDVMHS